MFNLAKLLPLFSQRERGEKITPVLPEGEGGKDNSVLLIVIRGVQVRL
jgi:hypothetical protein